MMKRFVESSKIMFFLLFLLTGTYQIVFAAELQIPSHVTTIPLECFYGDTSLDKVTLPRGLERIEAGAFAYSSVREINLPASLTYIADNAFLNCSQLLTVKAVKGTYAYTWARNRGYIHEARALLIAENTFPDETIYRNWGDVLLMEDMLGSVSSRHGMPFEITSLIDPTYSEIRSGIQTTFADTMDGDVSLFFIATHGDSTGDGELTIPYQGTYNDFLSFSTLASWLSTYVKGEVIVILESCGAGSSIYSAYEENGIHTQSDEAEEFDPDRFLEAAIEAFEAEELKVQAESNSMMKSTGDLRKPKFYVLAAARHHEESYGNDRGNQYNSNNLFTVWLIQGIGTKDYAPADANKNLQLDLTELFDYIHTVGDTQQIRVREPDGSISINYQHVQRYPVGSTQVLFRHQ
ncbi:MAG: leucine-rich repeat protein [Anaerolineaceae bacterium]|nr:leucine-rich repeat protein [Anaerolineaceae bacterium]